MRRAFALVVIAMLLAALIGAPAAAAPAARSSGLSGSFDLISQQTGEVLGHAIVQLTSPTTVRLVPGRYDFIGAAGNETFESHAQVGTASFWYDPGNQGGSNVAYFEGVECAYGGYGVDCHRLAAQFVNVLDPTATDYAVFQLDIEGPPAIDHPCPASWSACSEYIQNISGPFVLYVAHA